MESRLIPIHLKCVQDQASQQPSVSIAHSPSGSPLASDNASNATLDSMDCLAGHLFTLTLTNDGPDPVMHMNKMWNSHTNFQRAGSSSNVISSPPASVLIEDISTSLRCLTTLQPPNTNHDGPIARPNLPPPSSSSAVISSLTIVGGCKIPKKDRNHCVVKALQILCNIEQCLQQCSHLLLTSVDVDNDDLHREVFALRSTLNQITPDAESVMMKKETLCRLLNELDSCFTHLP